MRNHEKLTVVQASILELDDTEMARLVAGCSAVASCLGHNMTFKGLFGPPRRLVAEATRRLCAAIHANQPEDLVKFALKNTTANFNRDLVEHRSFRQRLVIGLVRLVLPPHGDIEQAADYLRTVVGQSDPDIEWAAVRPDTLIDLDDVTDIDIHKSPTRAPIFAAGRTSRINVAQVLVFRQTSIILLSFLVGI